MIIDIMASLHVHIEDLRINADKNDVKHLGKLLLIKPLMEKVKMYIVQSAAEADDEVVEVEVEEPNDESAEQANITFLCIICDFVSNWENGLQIHITRKHTNMEQIFLL